MNRLEVRQLSAGYGGRPVIEGIDIDVDEGEIVALLGRNGAGKTTTLMSIAGALPRTEGEVRVGGVPLTGPSHRRTRDAIGLVLEGRSAFSSLTTAQNLELARADPHDVLDMFPELEPRLHVRAGQLSGGEQQMLCLGRAIARSPKVLLVDEVTFGLAPIMCERLFEVLASVVERTGMAVLLVEQHLHSAAQICSRSYVMSDGRIRLQMSSAELRTREAEIEAVYLGGPDTERSGAASRASTRR